MTFKTHARIARGPIDPAPMVNLLFVLLIFFILGSTFVLQPGIRVDLPQSAVKTPGAFQGLVVTMTQNDAVFFNQERTSMEALERALQQATSRGGGPQELVIKADKQVPHGKVVQVMSIAIDAGIPSINIATRPEVPPTGAP